MTDQTHVEPADVVEAMVQIRDRRAQLKKEFEAEDKKLKEKWSRGERWLISHLQEHRLSNMGIDDKWTVFKTETLRAGVGDWNAISDHIKETGDVDLLEHRISSKSVKEFMEVNNGQVPPGVSVDTKLNINIRKK